MADKLGTPTKAKKSKKQMDNLHLDELQLEMTGYTDRDGKFHTNNEKYYPIIKTPQELIDIKTEKIDIDLLFPFPIITKKTIDLDLPIEPIKPNSLFIEIVESIANILLGGLGLLSLWYIQLPILTNIIFFGGPICIIKGILKFLLAIKYNKDSQNKYVYDYKQYQYKFSIYTDTAKRIEDDYVLKFNNNEKITIPKIKKKRDEFNKNTNNVQTDYRNQRLSEILMSAVLPMKLDDVNDYTKGVTELFFYKKLIRHFPEKIFTNYTIQLSSSRPYLPDFVYYDKEINLVIDIEIDEPYVANSKSPIHYRESGDFMRDEFFLNRKWTVIRFAEEQIVKHPDECCKLIEKVIFSILNIDKIGYKYHNDLKIETLKLWTFEEANKLAISNYREGYLKNIIF